MRGALILTAALALDLWLGDPPFLPHPVSGMGRVISRLEPRLRRLFSPTPRGEGAAGLLICFLTVSGAAVFGWLCVWGAGRFSPLAGAAVSVYLGFQLLAAKGLYTESKKVYDALSAGDTPKARRQLSFLVGRDTERLEHHEIVRAAVETVSENICDAIVAPMIFMALGGAAAGMAYKAINTLDSMIGYQNERYRHFGTAAAKLDDAANYIPSRIAALLTVAAAFLAGLNAKNAFRIWTRDRRRHKSPNSAQTEAAAAGALGIMLGGGASYFGQRVCRPTIGDDLRAPQNEDILLAGRLALLCAFLCLVLCAAASIIAVTLEGLV
jgi:adenosylcobinamide-phosphate synthase